ncbi:MAG: tyrosine-type recombinase/integrase [Clostridia bacterium]|nr:tyrosine-type recombinase/integrase [Clostridia bacterium]
MERLFNLEKMHQFKEYLLCEERSTATIGKYLHDLNVFYGFMNGKELSKANVLEFKSNLLEKYTVTSANSMLAAVNVFFRFLGWFDLCVKQYKIQKPAFCPEEKELTRAEYRRLIETAKRKNNIRLNLIIQTICSSGIRVSELQYITVEAVHRGEAFVNCKGKNRRIFIVRELQKKLLEYIKLQRIKSGAVFITKNGKPVSRHNIWRDMKALCKDANVPSSKVFPHNLRHLFARTFYNIEKDISKLADILGHTNINTTRIYIITTASEHKRKMGNMRLII